jgi:hypothetical protein
VSERQDTEFAGLCRALPADALVELEAILTAGHAKRLHLDETAIARALLKSRMVRAPPLLDRYATKDWIAASHGRAYELSLDVNPTHARSVLAVHEQYLAECRCVEERMAQGMSAAEAWQRLRTGSLLADLGATPTRSRRHKHPTYRSQPMTITPGRGRP